MQYFEDGFQIGVVLPYLVLESRNLPCQVFVGCEYLAQMHKRADDLNTRTNRYRALEHIGKHHGPVLGENMRPILNISAAFQSHSL